MIEATLVLCIMLFLHIFADFNLQGILASMKQADWWKKQDGYNERYKNDYKFALIVHSFEWAFLISLPIAIRLYYANSVEAFILYVLNLIAETFLHYEIDDSKANIKSINLVQDQLGHLAQIIATWLIHVVAIITSI